MAQKCWWDLMNMMQCLCILSRKPQHTMRITMSQKFYLGMAIVVMLWMRPLMLLTIILPRCFKLADVRLLRL